MILAEQPELFALLLRKVAGVELQAPLTRADAAVRYTQVIEVRPDLLFHTPDGASVALEVQGDEDDDKGRRWGVLMAVVHDTSGVMGDLVILTWSPRVARWAGRVGHVRGPLGTRSTLTPIVILLSGEVVEELLDPAHPELAFFAAWAMQHRHGRKAKRTVERALTITERLPGPLREAQRRAIYQVLSERMLAFLEEAAMDPSKIPESPRAREVREKQDAMLARAVETMDPLLKAHLEAGAEARGEARGEVRGEARALLTFLTARGFAPSDADRARVLGCRDLATLDRWTRQAVTASSIDAALL